MEQIIKLTGRIAEVMPIQQGVSARTGNAWESQNYLFEYFEWSGANYPKRVVVRVFGHDRINQFNLAAMNGEVKLTISLNANQSQEGRWFNEVNVVNAEPVNGTQQPAHSAQQPAQAANAPAEAQQSVAQPIAVQTAAKPAEPANYPPGFERPATSPENGKDDDLPF